MVSGATQLQLVDHNLVVCSSVTGALMGCCLRKFSTRYTIFLLLSMWKFCLQLWEETKPAEVVHSRQRGGCCQPHPPLTGRFLLVIPLELLQLHLVHSFFKHIHTRPSTFRNSGRRYKFLTRDWAIPLSSNLLRYWKFKLDFSQCGPLPWWCI